MEKMLYESKGGAKKMKRISMAGCVLLAIIGVVFCFISQMKVDSVRNGTFTTVGNMELFTFGKAYMFSSDDRAKFIAVGIGCCVFGVLMFFVYRSSMNEYFRIYEKHIEGVTLNCFWKQEYNLTFGEIKDVQIVRVMGVSSIIMQTQYRKYVVSLNDDGQEAYMLLKDRKSA